MIRRFVPVPMALALAVAPVVFAASSCACGSKTAASASSGSGGCSSGGGGGNQVNPFARCTVLFDDPQPGKPVPGKIQTYVDITCPGAVSFMQLIVNLSGDTGNGFP